MRRGFTLVELLIVIAILAILSTLGVSNFQSSRIKAKDISRKSDLQTIGKSLEAYINDHHRYPLSNTNGEIICKSDNVTTCPWGSKFSDDNATTIYASVLPMDPAGYDYRYISGGDTYSLYAYLENENDPAIQTYPGIMCGTMQCNYKIGSSNQ